MIDEKRIHTGLTYHQAFFGFAIGLHAHHLPLIGVEFT
ncbi:hypothetical protein SRABI130_02621 [Pseudomonas sp. Bi130]|nr:hypothetical protein SRABI130_02621 [Pseudomonas sp. Bi130]